MISIEAAMKLEIGDGRKIISHRARALTANLNVDEEYKQLFQLRGDYVHGRKMTTRLTPEHRSRARILARDVADALLRNLADFPIMGREEYLRRLYERPGNQDKNIVYDPVTDSMYVKLRPDTGVDSQVDDARDLVIDLGADGEPVGYDIQHASDHPDVVAEALRLMRRHAPSRAAE
ncbi:MAG: DUF2283 domain-containing protein [Alphaproteobacteria bacterium]|nr:DUF2283 domain-containing protein [Alphaproteobacteria bacterium]